jgi:indole-3-glycerol phosphate synthase
MVAKQNDSVIEKMRNQILALCITALATGIGINVLFITTINQRINTFEKALEKLDKKVDYIIEGMIVKPDKPAKVNKADF